MSIIPLEDARVHLSELIAGLKPGDEIIITQDQKPVARLVPEPKQDLQPLRPGSMKGTVLYMAPDFNAPLDEFKDYTK